MAISVKLESIVALREGEGVIGGLIRLVVYATVVHVLLLLVYFSFIEMIIDHYVDLLATVKVCDGFSGRLFTGKL